MTKKIFRSTVAVGLAVLLASLVIIMGALYTYFGHVQEQQLRDELSIAAAAMESGDGEAYLSKLHSDNYRITWLRADGTVLYDTKADAAAMENHAQREEVRQALTNGTGESSRYSATLLEKPLYYARRLPDGTVLRLSASRVTMGVLLLSMLSAILAVIAVALILSGILAGRVSRRITRPLNTLDLEHPLENDAYEELSPLLRRLEHQRRQIDDQLRSLRRRSEEFEQITASMTEGLVLVDNGGTILSMNPAACAVFHTDAACVGQPLLTVERGSAVSHALHDAMDTGHGETRMERDGREYQFDMTRIQADGEVVGAVLLTFDVTEQAYAERNRREFTANVSHELKTPMTTIGGYIDGMLDGTIPPEKQQHYMQIVSGEVRRLSRLVRNMLDIAKLQAMGVEESRKTRFDLGEELSDVLITFEQKIYNKHLDVRVDLPDKPVWTRAERDSITQVIYNLIDNAIKFCPDGGRLALRVQVDGGKARVSVENTGPTIDKDELPLLFDRFHKADKSRSADREGWGLGLYIAKTIVGAHGGDIWATSENGVTQFNFTLPTVR